VFGMVCVWDGLCVGMVCVCDGLCLGWFVFGIVCWVGFRI